MTRRRTIHILVPHDGSTIEEQTIRRNGKLSEMMITGRFEVEEEGHTVHRQMTIGEKTDYINSVRSVMADQIQNFQIHENFTRDSFLKWLEDSVEDIKLEYDKMIVRSYLKRFTPKKNEVYAQELADELEVDMETVQFVVDKEQWDLDYRRVIEQKDLNSLK